MLAHWRHPASRFQRLLHIGTLSLAAWACDQAPHDARPPALEHAPPHAGTLVHLGERHLHHVELVLDKPTGRVELYTLDRTARRVLPPLDQPIDLRIQMDGLPGDKPFDFVVEMSPDAAAGCYVGQSTLLEHAQRFLATVKRVSIDGSLYEDLAIEYPRGNEYD